MSEDIESNELKSGLPQTLDRVRLGEAFMVTERGELVADILPRGSVSRQKIATAIADIKAGMRETAISDDRLKEYMEHGRRRRFLKDFQTSGLELFCPAGGLRRFDGITESAPFPPEIWMLPSDSPNTDRPCSGRGVPSRA